MLGVYIYHVLDYSTAQYAEEDWCNLKYVLSNSVSWLKLFIISICLLGTYHAELTVTNPLPTPSPISDQILNC